MRLDEDRQQVISILKEGKNGILSTISSETPQGYPVGNLVSYLVDQDSIIFMASNISDYVKNFTITEKVCLTVLKQDVDDGTINILHGVNFFGKVSRIDKEIDRLKGLYTQQFPLVRHIIGNSENKFFRIIPTSARYFDETRSFTISFQI